MKRTPIVRRTPMPRGASTLARSGRIKPKKRPVSEFRRIYGSRARIKFVESLPCAACGDANPPRRENAHTENEGLSRKGHYTTIIPLCSRCHGRQHGPNGGWMAIGMTAEGRRRAAKATEDAWLLNDVRILRDPIPARGQLGLWKLDPLLQAKVRAAVADAGAR